MVNPEFSEFQFAYGLTREIENNFSSSVVSPPTFPTQRREEIVGSDVIMRIREGNNSITPLFIQYKRSEQMVRSDAREWDDFGQEYLRFDIHTANQHNTLVDLCRGIGLAYYVAPGFHTSEEYVEYHRQGSLGENSVYVDTGSLPVVNDSNHRIAYTISPLRGLFYSEPQQVNLDVNLPSFIYQLTNGEGMYESFQALRGAFQEAREEIIRELNLEVDLYYYSTDEPDEWIRAQQRFFIETMNTHTLFINSVS